MKMSVFVAEQSFGHVVSFIPKLVTLKRRKIEAQTCPTLFPPAYHTTPRGLPLRVLRTRSRPAGSKAKRHGHRGIMTLLPLSAFSGIYQQQYYIRVLMASLEKLTFCPMCVTLGNQVLIVYSNQINFQEAMIFGGLFEVIANLFTFPISQRIIFQMS